MLGLDHLNKQLSVLWNYLMTYSYLVEQQVQRAIAHKLGDNTEKLGLVADAKDLDDVVEPGFVEHLGLLQQAVPLSEIQPGDFCSTKSYGKTRQRRYIWVDSYYIRHYTCQ